MATNTETKRDFYNTRVGDVVYIAGAAYRVDDTSKERVYLTSTWDNHRIEPRWELLDNLR